MPCDYSKYPRDWKTVRRPRILKRAGNKCENCFAENHTSIRRLKTNPEIYIPWNTRYQKMSESHPFPKMYMHGFYKKPIKIILTIAHLDHDPENWEVKDERLRALCQRCHLLYDKGLLKIEKEIN